MVGMEALLGGPIVGSSSLMERRPNDSDENSGLDDDSSSDSSIGAPDDSEEEHEVLEEEEVEDDEDHDENVAASSSEDAMVEPLKKKGFGSLGSLASLEDSLPIKRGLSIHMSGKSKSFTNLAEASIGSSVKDLEKTEHPFNKKRRILRWSRRNYYKGYNPKSMPVLPLIPDDDEEEDEEDEHQKQQQSSSEIRRGEGAGGGFSGSKQQQQQQQRVFKSSSYSCFSLADLPEDEVDDDD